MPLVQADHVVKVYRHQDDIAGVDRYSVTVAHKDTPADHISGLDVDLFLGTNFDEPESPENHLNYAECEEEPGRYVFNATGAQRLAPGEESVLAGRIYADGDEEGAPSLVFKEIVSRNC